MPSRLASRWPTSPATSGSGTSAPGPAVIGQPRSSTIRTPSASSSMQLPPISSHPRWIRTRTHHPPGDRGENHARVSGPVFRRAFARRERLARLPARRVAPVAPGLAITSVLGRARETARGLALRGGATCTGSSQPLATSARPNTVYSSAAAASDGIGGRRAGWRRATAWKTDGGGDPVGVHPPADPHAPRLVCARCPTWQTDGAAAAKSVSLSCTASGTANIDGLMTAHRSRMPARVGTELRSFDEAPARRLRDVPRRRIEHPCFPNDAKGRTTRRRALPSPAESKPARCWLPIGTKASPGSSRIRCGSCWVSRRSAFP